jgi:NADPH2:quinone reductase
MKAAVYYENGPPSVFKYEDVPDPVCAPDGVVVRHEAISIEGGDTLNRAGGALAGRPHVVGYQAAGRVLEIGAQVKSLKVGQRVTTVMFWGSHAELRAVPEALCWPVPDTLDIKKAAAIPVPFGTADDCLFEFGRMKAGETVLVHAAAGAVGLAAIQLAKRAGATVIATASSDARLAQIKHLGIDHPVNYATHDLVAEVMRITSNKGADVVVDPVGGTNLQKSIDSLAYRGRISFVGNAGRSERGVDPSRLMEGNRSLTGVFLGAEILTPRVRAMIQRHIDDAAAGKLTVVLDKAFPLREAAAAHDFIESRKAVGRVILIP